MKKKLNLSGYALFGSSKETKAELETKFYGTNWWKTNVDRNKKSYSTHKIWSYILIVNNSYILIWVSQNRQTLIKSEYDVSDCKRSTKVFAWSFRHIFFSWIIYVNIYFIQYISLVAKRSGKVNLQSINLPC